MPLGINIHPETFCCGRMEEGKVAKLYVTTEVCEHRRFFFFVTLWHDMK